MELRHLRYFVAVAEHLHFGRAANALSTAQPSLSRQIVALENELGVKLFERNNRSVSLTGAGRQFLSDARQTLQAADASMRRARESVDGTRGELRVGFIGGAMLTALPEVLREYRLRYPDVSVIPFAMPYPRHFPALRAGVVDIAWTIALPDRDIESEVASAHALMGLVPSGHRLAKKKAIDLADFNGETLIALSRVAAPILYDETIRLCTENGYHPAHIHEMLEEPSVVGMVAAGFGVSVVPDPWTVITIAGAEFRKLSTTTWLETALSWHRERNSPIVRSFVSTAREILLKRKNR